jgi:hypothetical protein
MDKDNLAKEIIECSKQIYQLMELVNEERDPKILKQTVARRKELQYQLNKTLLVL